MNNSNRFVTTDNMGFASILLEQYMNPNNLPGKVIVDHFNYLKIK